MNTINGISFYDALCKLTIGFLLTWFWMPELLHGRCTSCSCYNCVICEVCCCSCCIPELNAIQTMLFTIVCYIVGCLWQGMARLLPNKDRFVNLCEYIPYGKRNYLVWLSEAKDKVDKLIDSNKKEKNISYLYYEAYYNVSKTGVKGNISVLEATEAFLRYCSVIYVAYVIYIVWFLWDGTKISIVPFSESDVTYFIRAFLVFILIYSYLRVWRYYNKKIYFLVWEADKYIKILKDSNKKENEMQNCSANKK